MRFMIREYISVMLTTRGWLSVCMHLEDIGFGPMYCVHSFGRHAYCGYNDRARATADAMIWAATRSIPFIP